MRVVAYSQGRVKHDQIIGALPPRSWLVLGSMLDDVWLVSTQRQGEERETPIKLRFDLPIRGWPNEARLNDAEFESDLITAKLFVFLSLEPDPIGWLKTASSVGPVHRRHLNYIRWRVDRGIMRNSRIGPAHHRDFERRYRKAGLEGLLELRKKAIRLVTALEHGELVLPKHARNYFFHEGIEALLGLSINQTPPEAIDILAAYAARNDLRFNRSPRKPAIMPDHTKRRAVTANADLSIFYRLSRLRGHLTHDPMGYDAYADEGELSKSLGGWVEETTRTDDSPAYQTSVLINSSLKIVLSDLPEKIVQSILRLGAGEEPGKVFDEITQRVLTLGFGSVSPLYLRNRLLDSSAVKTTSRELLFKILVGCCIVVIAAFSARRKGELMSLRPGCIILDDYQETWLETWISKKQRFTTRIPANKATARAVAILEFIRESTKEFGESEWLLDYTDSHGKVKIEFNSILRYLADWFNIPPLPDGSYWTFAAHQLRKFFAVSHQWRYMFPDLLVLNYQLRQLDRRTTAGYCKMEAGKALALHEDREITREDKNAYIWSTEDRMVALREEEASFVRQICLSALNGEIKLGGVGGRTLYSDLKRVVSLELTISSTSTQSQSFNDSLDEFLGAVRMQVHPEGHSICSCGASKSDKEVAMCLQLKERLTGLRANEEPGVDHTYAAENVCAFCPKNIRIKALSPYWERQVDEAEAAMSSTTFEVRKSAIDRKEFLLGILSEFQNDH